MSKGPCFARPLQAASFLASCGGLLAHQMMDRGTGKSLSRGDSRREREDKMGALTEKAGREASAAINGLGHGLFMSLRLAPDFFSYSLDNFPTGVAHRRRSSIDSESARHWAHMPLPAVAQARGTVQRLTDNKKV